MQKRKEKLWCLREQCAPDEEALTALAKETGVSPLVARLLLCRGFSDAAAIRRFLRLEDTSFHSPFLLRDMDKAVARVRAALERGERIAIYGDYDVDGVTSVSLVYLYLTGLGADVIYYIPSRSGEGYGLSLAAIDKLYAAGARCIVTVDTGVTANREAEYARSLGIDMVITDHHECQLPLPEAAAVVNPHRPDCEYPFKELAGVGVAFKLSCAIEATIGREKGESEAEAIRRVSARFADLVAIGTIADVMSIVDENRLIVKLGLARLSGSCRAGLAVLMEESSRTSGGQAAKKKRITSSTIGFGIAPRLNAAGRMSDATRAVELLLCEDRESAAVLAAELCEINRRRQSEENAIAEEVYRRIDRDFDPEKTRVLVLEDDAWRQGIIGIVASRVTERYGLPSILISFDGATRGFDSPDDCGKGSGRSVKGLNLVEALRDSEDLLVKFGGHELAAGLTVTRGNIEQFRERINAYAANRLPEGGVQARLDADMELSLSDVTTELAVALSELEPYGTGNPTPQFILRDLSILHITELSGGKHLKLLVGDGSCVVSALLFSTSLSDFGMREGDRADLLCTIGINEYQNNRTVQLTVVDSKPSAAYAKKCAEWEAQYREIRAGASFTDAALIPEREDFAKVYTVLRREFRAGHDTFPLSSLLTLVNADRERTISYVSLCYILEIFHELKICGVEEYPGRLFRFDIYFSAAKTSIEKSQILKKLKSQLRRQGEEG